MSGIAILYVTISALIDIIANMMIAKSDGFRRKSWGIGAIILVWVAFTLLGQAVKTMDLAVAYAMWGAIGVTGTAACGRILFGHRLRPLGWFGIAAITVSVIVLSAA
jgi:spermidine export protein MdtI